MPMSFLERVRAQFDAKQQGKSGLAGFIPAPPKRHRNLIRTNSFDRAEYQMARRTEPIGKMIDGLDKGDEHMGGERPGFDQAPELVQGVYHMFSKAVPEIAGKREVERDLYVARKILEEMQENPQLKELQDMTVGSQMMSTMAVTAMEPVIHEILTRTGNTPQPDAPGKGGGGGQGQPGQGQGQPDPNGQGQPGGGQGQGQPDPNGQGQPGQGPGQPGQGQPDPNGQPESGDGSGQPDPMEDDLTEGAEGEFDPNSPEAQAAAAEQAEAEWEKAMDDMLDDLDLDRLVDQALEAANDEVSELESARRGIGLEDGEWQSMSPEQQLAMAKRLSTPEMKALAQMIGRMRNFAWGVKATRINDVPHEPYDVTTGDDILNALKPQFALLGHPATKLEFVRRVAEKELLVYKKRGTEEAGKGPIVMCIDKSGSMSGSPMNWAMGVAEALRRFAAEEDRDIHVLFFGNNDDRTRFEFPKGKAPFEKVLAFLGTVANGGTQFDGVLTEALQRASTSFDGEGRGKADIIFITDGLANLSEQWIEGFNAERERVGVRVYSVYIGGSYDYGYSDATGGPLGLLGKISDATIPVKELRPEAAELLFAKV